jgi:hypothetical protein
MFVEIWLSLSIVLKQKIIYWFLYDIVTLANIEMVMLFENSIKITEKLFLSFILNV